SFPDRYRSGADYSEFLDADLCMCPDCRRARGQETGAFEDFDEDDGALDLDAIFKGSAPPSLPGVPPEVSRMLFQEATKAIERGESLDSMLNRLFGPGAGFRGRRGKGRRR